MANSVGLAIAEGALISDSLEPVVEQLGVRGLLPDTKIESYMGTRWVYFTDPEGNRFEIKDNRG